MRGTDFLDKLELTDPAFMEAAGREPVVKKRRRAAWGVAAACICLLMGSAAAIAANGGGTWLMEVFTSQREPGSDYSESGYDLSVEIERVPMEALQGEIREVPELIRQQIREAEMTSSWFPGHWQRDFASRDEACDYIGFDGLMKRLDWDLEEQRTTLSVYGDPDGQLLQVRLESGYIEENIRLQCFSTIYTENDTGEIVIGSRTTEGVEFRESFYTTGRDKRCHMIESSALESGYLGLDGYVVDHGVLYQLHIAYLEEDALRARELMYQWAGLF